MKKKIQVLLIDSRARARTHTHTHRICKMITIATLFLCNVVSIQAGSVFLDAAEPTENPRCRDGKFTTYFPADPISADVVMPDGTLTGRMIEEFRAVMGLEKNAAMTRNCHKEMIEENDPYAMVSFNEEKKLCQFEYLCADMEAASAHATRRFVELGNTPEARLEMEKVIEHSLAFNMDILEKNE